MNIYVKIGMAAVIASYIAPKISNRFTGPEMSTMDAYKNMAAIVGIHAGVTAGVYHAIGAILGGPKATAAGGGGAT